MGYISYLNHGTLRAGGWLRLACCSRAPPSPSVAVAAVAGATAPWLVTGSFPAGSFFFFFFCAAGGEGTVSAGRRSREGGRLLVDYLSSAHLFLLRGGRGGIATAGRGVGQVLRGFDRDLDALPATRGSIIRLNGSSRSLGRVGHA